MSVRSSSLEKWSTLLQPANPAVCQGRGDPRDPRLGDIVERWGGGETPAFAGKPVIVGFPCDEGVRRNSGRPGAALGPDAIRVMLYRLTTWDTVADVQLASGSFADLGNIKADVKLEEAQHRLGEVIAHLLEAGGIPIVLGGGHETAFGHYAGYVQARQRTAILNIDAHLDVRPYDAGGHSGSPFRQAIEHIEQSLSGGGYVVLGAQRQSVAKEHAEYVQAHGGRIYWLPEGPSVDWARDILNLELDRLTAEFGSILLTVDADAFGQAEVPGVSAPSPVGLPGSLWPVIASLAGRHRGVRSLEIVEVNPNYDRDGQTARWAALGVRQFLLGAVQRTSEKS